MAAALQLVHLYAERGSPKYEKAALRWLERYIVEGTPTLTTFARMTNTVAELDRAEAGWRNAATYPRV